MRSQRRTALVLALAAIGGAGALTAAGVSAKSSTKPSGSVTKVDVVDNVFKPRHPKIKPGQSVKWTWDKTNLSAHNVTLFKGPTGVTTKQFTSKTAARHYTFKRTFTVVGKYQFICTIHPGMGMNVVVKQ